MTKSGKRVRNSVVRIEVSPAPEHTKDFTIADWEKLWDDFVREFDSIELTGKDGKVYSPKTNLRGSKGQVYLHLESNSGVPHLHAAFCRIDGQGRVNNDHGIHLRAQGTSSFTRYTEYRTGSSPYRMEVDGESHRFFIPDDVLQVFNDEFDYRETANSRELTDMAVALFIGMTGVPAVPASGGGGGGSSDLPWKTVGRGRTGMGTPLCPRSGKDCREENEVGTKNVTTYGQEI